MKYSFKIIICILLIAIPLCSLVSAYSAQTAKFHITDTHDDTKYTISCTDSKVTIRSSSDSADFYIDNAIRGVICYNGTFTFLCTMEKESGDFRYIVYFYNIQSTNLHFYATDCNADKDNRIFASDKNNNIYLTDSFDRRILYKYSENSSKITVICPEIIRQLMCIDGEGVLAFTVSGVYTLKDNCFAKIPDINPVPPCQYIGKNTISDTNGIKFIYKNSSLSTVSDNDDTKPDTASSDITIKDNFIYIPSGTTYAELYKTFDVNKGDFCISKQDFSPLVSGKLGTGMTATYGNDKYTIIVTGDLTGEGNVNTKDLKTLMKHLTGELILSKTALKASDVNSDNFVNTKDLLALSRLY